LADTLVSDRAPLLETDRPPPGPYHHLPAPAGARPQRGVRHTPIHRGLVHRWGAPWSGFRQSTEEIHSAPPALDERPWPGSGQAFSCRPRGVTPPQSFLCAARPGVLVTLSARPRSHRAMSRVCCKYPRAQPGPAPNLPTRLRPAVVAARDGARPVPANRPSTAQWQATLVLIRRDPVSASGQTPNRVAPPRSDTPRSGNHRSCPMRGSAVHLWAPPSRPPSSSPAGTPEPTGPPTSPARQTRPTGFRVQLCPTARPPHPSAPRPATVCCRHSPSADHPGQRTRSEAIGPSVGRRRHSIARRRAGPVHRVGPRPLRRAPCPPCERG